MHGKEGDYRHLETLTKAPWLATTEPGLVSQFLYGLDHHRHCSIGKKAVLAVRKAQPGLRHTRRRAPLTRLYSLRGGQTRKAEMVSFLSLIATLTILALAGDRLINGPLAP